MCTALPCCIPYPVHDIRRQKAWVGNLQSCPIFLLVKVVQVPHWTSRRVPCWHMQAYSLCISSHLRAALLDVGLGGFFSGCVAYMRICNTDSKLHTGCGESHIYTWHAQLPFNYHCEGVMISWHDTFRWGAGESCEHQCLMMENFD